MFVRAVTLALTNLLVSIPQSCTAFAASTYVNGSSQAIYLLVGFCSGDFTRSFLGGAFSVRLGTTVLRAEGMTIAFLCSLNWIRTLSGGRTYHLPIADGKVCEVRKWEPDHTSLALSCLFSPVQIACLLVPYMDLDEDGGLRPSIAMLAVATAHGYGCLLLSSMFFKKERVQRAISNSVYAKEVEFRNNETNLRRTAERQVRLVRTKRRITDSN